jgi:hypothetical protein
MNQENPDPRGEYIRTCPYCEDVFTANHMLQIYCPEKDGMKNYCKNRNKRLLANLIRDEQLNEFEEQPPGIIINDPENADQAIDTGKEPSKWQNNTILSLLEMHLGNRHSVCVPVGILRKAGMKFEDFDQRYQIPNTELYIATYGPYAVAWSNENIVLLTFKKEIPWMIQ